MTDRPVCTVCNVNKLAKPRWSLGICSRCNPNPFARPQRHCDYCNRVIKGRNYVMRVCSICIKSGKDKETYTAADFDLSKLSYRERCLVFMWAIGEDISEWLDPRQVMKNERDIVREHNKEDESVV